MKKIKYIIFILALVMLMGCSSTPPVNLNNEIWFGTVTRPGNNETLARLTFRQEGKAVEGSLELGETAETLSPDSELTGKLEGNSINMNTATNDTAIFGDFNGDGTTFSGTLRFTEEDQNDDFTLTLTYQQDVASNQ